MKRRYFISDRIVGVYFTSIGQCRSYLKNCSSAGKIDRRLFLRLTEVKLKDIDEHWKECTL